MNGGVVYSDIGNYNPPVKVNKIIIKNNSLAIKIDAGIPQEDDIYLRVVATDYSGFDTPNDMIVGMLRGRPNIFFPIRPAIYDRLITEENISAKVTDLNAREGANFIEFDNFIVEDYLCIFLIFYSEGQHVIYKFNILNNEKLLLPKLTFDNRDREEEEKNINISLPARENKSYFTGKQEKHSFSKFYHCFDDRQNLRFMFAFDLLEHLRERVAFPEMLTAGHIFDAIKHVEVHRRRENFPKTEMIESKLIPVEVTKIKALNNDGVVYYSGIDETIRKGRYQYVVSVIISDPTISMAETHVTELATAHEETTFINQAEDEIEAAVCKKHFPAMTKYNKKKFDFLTSHVVSDASISKEMINKTTEKIQNSMIEIKSRVKSYKASKTITPISGSSGKFKSKFEHGGMPFSVRSIDVSHAFGIIDTRPDVIDIELEFDDDYDATFPTINAAVLNNPNSFISFAMSGVTDQKAVEAIKVPIGKKYDGNTTPTRHSRYDPEHARKIIDKFDLTEDRYDDYSAKGLASGAVKKQKEGLKKVKMHNIVIQQDFKSLQLEYLSSYGTSFLNNKRSISMESWNPLVDPGLMPPSDSGELILVRINNSENLRYKYFLVI